MNSASAHVFLQWACTEMDWLSHHRPTVIKFWCSSLTLKKISRMINLLKAHQNATNNIPFNAVYQNVLNPWIYPSKQWRKSVYRNLYNINKPFKGMLFVANYYILDRVQKIEQSIYFSRNIRFSDRISWQNTSLPRLSRFIETAIQLNKLWNDLSIGCSMSWFSQ